MPGPVLVIDFSCGDVRLAAFTATGELLSSAVGPLTSGRSSSEGLSSALSGLLRTIAEGSEAAGGIGAEDDYGGLFGDVFLSLPPQELSLRVLSLPFTDRARIKEVLRFELSGRLPFEVEDAVVDGVPLEGGGVLSVAVEKEVIRRYLDALKPFGLDPVWAGSACLMIPALIEGLFKPGGTYAFVSGDFLSVGRNGKNVFLNSFDDAAGLEMSLGYLKAEGTSVEKVFFDGVDESGLKELIGPGPALERLALPGSEPGRLAGAFALMEAVRKGALGETIDLRTGEFAYTKKRVLAVKRLKTLAVLVSVIAALFLADSFVRYKRYSGELDAYKEAIRGEYLKLFPEERGKAAAADEVYLLNAKLKALDREAKVAGEGVSALEILKTLTEAASSSPSMNIRIFEVTVADGRLNARGEGASFEAANSYKDALAASGAFEEVKLSEVNSRAAGGVSFSISGGL